MALSRSGGQCVNSSKVDDSGLCQCDQSVQFDNDSPHVTDIGISTDIVEYSNEAIQCVRYDIATAPVEHSESQTSRAHKSKNIQVGGVNLRNKIIQTSMKNSLAV